MKWDAEFWKRHRVALSTSALGLAAAITFYRSYYASKSKEESATCASPPAQTRSSLFSWLSALSNYSKAASAMSSSVAMVTTDLQAFLSSSESEVPHSLHQLLKLLQSQEVQGFVQASASNFASGVAQGAVAGMGGGGGSELRPEVSTSDQPNPPSSLETIIEAILSDKGHSLLGLAVGIASKNATSCLCDLLERVMASSSQGEAHGGGEGEPSILSPAGFLHVLASEDGDRVVSMLITRSIQTAVRTYVEATAGYSMYDDMLGSVSKKENRDVVTEIISRTTAVFCKEVASAYRKATTHGSSSTSSSRSNSNGGRGVGVGIGVGVVAGTTGRGAPVLSSMTPSSSRSSMDGLGGSLGGARCEKEGGGDFGPAVAGALLLHRTSSSGVLPPLPNLNARQAEGTASLQRQNDRSRHPQDTTSQGHNGPSTSEALHSIGLKPVASSPASWIRQVVDLAREKDVRALAVDVVGSATREATRGMVESLVQCVGGRGLRRRRFGNGDGDVWGGPLGDYVKELDCTGGGLTASPYAVSVMTSAVHRLSMLVTLLILLVFYMSTTRSLGIVY